MCTGINIFKTVVHVATLLLFCLSVTVEVNKPTQNITEIKTTAITALFYCHSQSIDATHFYNSFV